MSIYRYSGNVPKQIGTSTVNYKFDLDDDVKVTDTWHHEYGYIGTIINRWLDSLGLPKYEVKITGGQYWGGYTVEVLDEGQLSLWTSAAGKNLTIMRCSPARIIGEAYNPYVDYSNSTIKSACRHEWKETKLIFSTVYDCKKCGKKKEDEDSGVPF
jgi:hypothetical protein